MSEKTGKVWLVGAGPSDVDLLTIKAKNVIEQADVIVYDRLIGQSMLTILPQNAEYIDVGKRAGNHTMPQEEMNALLLRLAREGKRVVRLKGGDPFVFGRGGEELELLSRHGIPFEVVPGVTSAISVPAYNGIPVTHRDCTSSLHIITGHRKKGEELTLDYEALVRTKGTLVFLMSIRNLAEICQGLVAAGMDPAMPAAVLQQGTTAKQKKIVATVSTLPEEVERQGIEPPGMILVGKVCAYHEEFSWFEKKPLFGEKIVVTRPRESISRISAMLREQGAQVLEVPTIATVPIAENKVLDRAIEQMGSYDYLVFTSPAGVTVFFEKLREKKMDIRRLGNGKIASIGQGTSRKLAEYAVYPDLVPEISDGQHLGIALGEALQDGAHILIPRAAIGNQELIGEIKKRKQVVIDDVPTYETVMVKPEYVSLRDEFEFGSPVMALFTSASTVRGFAAAAGDMDFSCVTAACIGKQTKAAADALGMRTFVAKEATLEALVELAIAIHQGR